MIISVIIVLMISTISSFHLQTKVEQPNKIENSKYSESAPLIIMSNEDFSILGFPGEGIETNPFRIENLSFDLNISGGDYAIYIFETNVSFTIQDCTFIGKSSFPYGIGIHLWNVSNFDIKDNDFTRIDGVYWTGGRNGIIANNTFVGVCLEDYGHDNLAISIQWNQINCIGVRVEENKIFNCAVGIGIYDAEEGFFKDNEIINCSIGIHIGHVYHNISVMNNICNNGTQTGIHILQSEDLQITNNTCNFNRLYGIWMDSYSTNVTIAFNEACWNGNTSIFIQQPVSRFWILSDLRDACGIWVSPNSEGNHILWNDLANNLNNALNDAEGNLYDYNYWSDYEGSDDDDNKIGDQPYLVSGYVSAIDEHPRLITLNDWNYTNSVINTSSTTEGITNTSSTTNNSNPLNLDIQQLILIVSGVGVIIVLMVIVRARK